MITICVACGVSNKHGKIPDMHTGMPLWTLVGRLSPELYKQRRNSPWSPQKDEGIGIIRDERIVSALNDKSLVRGVQQPENVM